MFPTNKIRITPVLGVFSTVGGTSLSGKMRYADGDISVVVQIMGSTAGATLQSATVACNWDFSVLESSAATAAGSVITGATMTLGAATALTLRGAVSLVAQVASDLATTAGLTLNGITYKATAAGATAKNGAGQLADYINGVKGSNKLPHYMAIADHSSANLLLVTGDDDLGTGITAVATSGGPQIFINHLQGVINVAAGKLSTVTPKYIGVGCTALTGGDTAIVSAQIVTYPKGAPSTPGVVVDCTT